MPQNIRKPTHGSMVVFHDLKATQHGADLERARNSPESHKKNLLVSHTSAAYSSHNEAKHRHKAASLQQNPAMSQQAWDATEEAKRRDKDVHNVNAGKLKAGW